MIGKKDVWVGRKGWWRLEILCASAGINILPGVVEILLEQFCSKFLLAITQKKYSYIGVVL